MKLKEKTVRKNYRFMGKIINVRCDDAELPDGKPCTREVVEHPGGACVLAVTGGSVVLVRQYRYAYGEELLEVPAGKLEKGEDPAVAAKRELEEETGLVADALTPIFTFYPTPGYSNEKIYIYEAVGIGAGRVHPDADEFLDVVRIPLEEAYAMVEDGRIKDGKTIAALQYAKLKGRGA